MPDATLNCQVQGKTELSDTGKRSRMSADMTKRNAKGGSGGEGKWPDKPGLKARLAASKILGAVVDRKTPLDGMLDHDNGNAVYRDLNEADRALVRAILNSALRHLPHIDAMLACLLQSPLPEGARALQHVLAVAAAQILYLDIPDHSAVDLAVEQANRDPRSRRFASLVNAVLRRLVREKAELLATIPQTIPSIPKWFFDRLVTVYGRDQAMRIAEAQMLPAAIDVTVKSRPEHWATELNGALLPTGSIRLSLFDGSIPSLPGFSEGEWWVQDAAAAIPAQLFGDLSGKLALDLCAAPGGKTAQMIAGGAKVTAIDQSASRLKRLQSNLARLGLEAATLVASAANYEADRLFDAVLLDAPCSSTGTTRRHPDVLWTKGPADIQKLAGVQENLLRHALTLVKPGGLLVFSNCSLDPMEGEDVIVRVLADFPDFRRVPIDRQNWPGLEEAISPLGEFRTTPAMLPGVDGRAGGLDGFFASVLQRLI
jgi:16S rRNA (cytosine967-C5)-methyltransferase